MKTIALSLLLAGSLLAQSQKKSDTWQRQKECSAKAEKLAETHFIYEDGWVRLENHYSPKYGHCYVYFLYDKESLKQPKPDTWPARHQEVILFDAFENNWIARKIITIDKEGHSDEYCTMDGIPENYNKPGSCDKWHDFMDDHLKN